MSNIKNQKGQALVEAILIMALFLITTRIATDYMRNNEVIRNMVETPWNKIKNLIETGNDTSAHDQAVINHPNHRKRHVSLQGDPPK